MLALLSFHLGVLCVPSPGSALPVLHRPVPGTATPSSHCTGLSDQEAGCSVGWASRSVSGGVCTGLVLSAGRQAGSCQRRCSVRIICSLSGQLLGAGTGLSCSQPFTSGRAWHTGSTHWRCERMNEWTGGSAENLVFFFFKHEIAQHVSMIRAE